MLNPYFWVMSLPRSGTAWLASFLTSGRVICLHDPLAEAHGDVSVVEARFRALLDKGYMAVGGVTTDAACSMDAALKWLPGARFGAIFRDANEVRLSLKMKGLPQEIGPDRLSVKEASRRMHEAQKLVPASRWMSINYRAMFNPDEDFMLRFARFLVPSQHERWWGESLESRLASFREQRIERSPASIARMKRTLSQEV